MNRYMGACHCGAVTFCVEADIEEVTSCDCSLCAKRGSVMAKVPEAGLTILTGEAALTLYRWNTGVAKHYFCSTCGVYTFHRKRSSPDHYGVNVACLRDFDRASVPFRAADGKTMTLESTEARPEWPGPRQRP